MSRPAWIVRLVPCAPILGRLLACVVVAVVSGLSGCCVDPPIIRDIRLFPQDAWYYLARDQGETPILSPEDHLAINAQFNQTFFSPWHRDRPAYDQGELLERLERFGANLGYGENKQPHSRQWLEALTQATALETFPNAGFAGITTAACDLRELPSHKPHFNDFERAGEGYPFDNLQYSAIPANTPVFVSHQSADGSWALVESHYGLGWLPSTDVARVAPAFICAWETGRYAAIIKDDCPVYDDSGRFLFKVGVGLMLPLVSQASDHCRVLVAVPDENRQARLKEIAIPCEAVVAKPMPLTRNNIAAMVNRFINQPYGWGGLFGNRDCSSTLKDFFVPFGLWLPRNSFHQAHHGGNYISLSGFSPTDKERTILAEAVPFLTLLWARGHIALYLGEQAGQPVVFHNLWGVRTRNRSGPGGAPCDWPCRHNHPAFRSRNLQLRSRPRRPAHPHRRHDPAGFSAVWAARAHPRIGKHGAVPPCGGMGLPDKAFK